MGELAWSPNGDSLAFLSGPDTVTLWTPDNNSLEVINQDKSDALNSGEIRSVSWRPPKTLTTSSGKSFITFFDLHGKQLQPDLWRGGPGPYDDPDSLYGISWRPDGQQLALASFRYGLTLLKPDGTQLKTPLEHQIWTASWSPEPYALAAGGLPGKVTIYSDDTPSTCTAQFDQWVWSVSWRLDGQSLAVGLNDGTVRLLRRDCTQAQATDLAGHTGPVSGLSWSSDSRLATASEQDRTVKLWDQKGTPLDTLQCATIKGGVQWRPHRPVLATLDQSGLVRLWKDNPLLKTFTNRAHAAVNDAALSPDGHILASASADGIILWQQNQHDKWQAEPHFLRSSDGSVISVSWSPDGQLLASTTLHTWTVWRRDGTLKKAVVDPNSNGFLTVSWHPDNQTIATGEGNTNITVWNSNNGQILGSEHCYDWAQSVAWNPKDGWPLAVGCHNNGGARLLEHDKYNNDRIVQHALPQKDGGHISWSPDGRSFAIGGNNTGSIYLYRRDGTSIRTIEVRDEVDEIVWSSDGQILAVASGNDVQLWKPDGSLLTVLKGHSRLVTSVMWNKQTLVSASEDGTVKLWQIDKGFAKNPLDTLLVDSCNWLKGYLDNNPRLSMDDRDLQGLCRSFYDR
jgi:WD40 repeat protein